MLGNIFLFTLIACALLYCWYFISSKIVGFKFDTYSDSSFFALVVKKMNTDFSRSISAFYLILLKVLLFIVTIGSIDFFAFSENLPLFTGYGGIQIGYDHFFYGLIVFEILKTFEIYQMTNANMQEVLRSFSRPLIIMLFLFSFSFYYQTAYSDYVILRQQAKIFSFISNYGCVTHFGFFLLFLFYVSNDFKKMKNDIIRNKIGLISNIINFLEIVLMQLFIIYAFLGWTAQLPMTDLVVDQLPHFRYVFEIFSLFIKLVFVHFTAISLGHFFGEVNSSYVRGLEKYLVLFAAANALLLMGLRLW